MPDAAAGGWVWPLMLGVLGGLVGSFVATIAVRWPRGRSAMRGRSACDGCGRTLTPIELVPLASAPLLGGRCRTCRVPIDPTHWRIEAIAAVIGAGAGWVAAPPAALAGAAFGWGLLALAALDVAALWLPDRLTGPLAIAGVIAGVAGIEPGVGDRLIGGAAGFATLWLVATGYRRWRGREGMGAGDPKLMGAIGLWLGWRMLPAVLLLAALAGLAFALLLKLSGREVARDTPLPFGALLAAAAYPAWLAMVAWAP